MNPQTSLPFGPSERWNDILRAIRSGIDATGGVKEWAFRFDVAPTLLSDALNERDRKNFQARWLTHLLMVIEEPHRGAVMQALGATAHYEVKECKPATLEEKLKSLRDVMDEELGPVVKARLLKKAGL